MENNMFKLGDLLNLVKYPYLTEKSVNLYAKQQYTFIVDRNLKKNEIKFVLEQMYKITVIRVNTALIPNKIKRVGKFIGKCSQYKKAYVKFKQGDKITY
jgi:large subunit ribosomal protein L23